jgi:two-component system response regulator PilR (NtrC family)
MSRPDVAERLLIVDDEQSMREWLSIALAQDGFEVESAGSGEEGLKVLERTPVDLALVDLRMPGMDGLETLRRVKQLDEGISVVIMTAYATAETAVQALKDGAYDYIIKPFKVDELRHLLQKALEERRLRGENQRLRREIELRYNFGNLIGKSPKMLEVFSTIGRLGDSKATVLVTGESGTGKELVAKAVHFNSNRKDRAFVTVNCGAIPQELMESELFGHVKGAFTGAVAAKQGLFEVADGGTLFLDEVSELPLHLQVKLLRVLEDPEIRPVGGVKPVRVDVRIVAATNRDLAQAIAARSFREDLFYRLNVISLHIQPLRERREDTPLLVSHFLQKFASPGNPAKLISPEALAALERFNWPGNVRELENVIERAVTLEAGPVLHVESLPESIQGPQSPEFGATIVLPDEGLDLDELMERIERDLLRQALRRAEGIQSRAAQLLRTSFRSFRYRLQKYGLERSD